MIFQTQFPVALQFANNREVQIWDMPTFTTTTRSRRIPVEQARELAEDLRELANQIEFQIDIICAKEQELKEGREPN